MTIFKAACNVSSSSFIWGRISTGNDDVITWMRWNTGSIRVGKLSHRATFPSTQFKVGGMRKVRRDYDLKDYLHEGNWLNIFVWIHFKRRGSLFSKQHWSSFWLYGIRIHIFRRTWFWYHGFRFCCLIRIFCRIILRNYLYRIGKESLYPRFWRDWSYVIIIHRKNC